MTLDQLKEYLEPLIHFGEIEFNIVKDEDGDVKIEVFERDNYVLVDEEGNVTGELGEDLSRPFGLSLSREGEIVFIEHPYGAFTARNKNEVRHLIELIGEKIEFVAV